MDRAFFVSRQKAQAEIILGNILVNGNKETKPGKSVACDCTIQILQKSNPYVSRGALKLKGALEDFQIQVADKVCCDLGASTGGFTEILLLSGARAVYAVDVGYGQLDWKLRGDARVTVYDRTNARFLNREFFGFVFDFICGDLSFISLKWILPVVSELLNAQGLSIMLIKPQFELEAEKNRKGIVKLPQDHQEAIRRVVSYSLQNGLAVEKLGFSHIKGAKGNVEYVILLSKRKSSIKEIVSKEIEFVVQEAERYFTEKQEVEKG